MFPFDSSFKHSVHPSSSRCRGGGGGWASRQIFEKGDLDRTSTFRGGGLFSGGGQFSHKE